MMAMHACDEGDTDDNGMTMMLKKKTSLMMERQKGLSQSIAKR